ncbi:hypothetical protein C4J98_3729 [Pseudomonas orientalis]|nr:hypothetical protein C4J98_3729 [Pseudomonas orientalis]
MSRCACRAQWLLAEHYTARHQQAATGDHQRRLQAAAQVAAHRGQQRPAQLANGKAGRQQPGAALVAVGRDLAQTRHDQLHASQKRCTAQQHSQRQAPAIAQQASEYTGRLQPQRGHQPAPGGVRILAAQAGNRHARRCGEAKARPEQVGLPGALELRTGHLRQESRWNDVAQAVQEIDPAQVRDAAVTASAGGRCSQRGRLRQEGQDGQQHHQCHCAIHQPQRRGALSQQIGAQRQQSGEHNAQARPREHQCSQAWPAGGNRQRLAQAGNHHQSPGAGDTGTETQQQVRPEAVGPIGRQGQQHAEPQSAVQAPLNMVMTAGEYRVHRTDKVTQVVGGRDQPGAGQVDLAFAEQMRHLRGKGKAANAHGHHQGDKAGG